MNLSQMVQMMRMLNGRIERLATVIIVHRYTEFVNLVRIYLAVILINGIFLK